MTAVAEFVAAARRARETAPSRTIDVAPAGVGLRVNFAGATVSEELPPGLLPADGAAQARAELWAFDSDETGVAPPTPPWPTSAFQSGRPEIVGFSEPPRLAAYHHEHATLSFYDEDAAAGVQWFRSAKTMSPWEGGAPVRDLLRWSLAPHGAHLTHAATAGGVLLCGASGAGKSTTSLACLLAGLPFTADDYSVLTVEGDRVFSHAVYSHAKATPETMQLLPGLEEFAAGARRDWRGKLRLPVAGRIARSQEVRAVVLPVLAEATGEPSPVDADEALRRVTAGNIAVMLGATQRSFAAIAAVLERLPAYELPCGPDPLEAAACIAELQVGSAA